MHISTTHLRWLLVAMATVCLVGTAHAQRTVTLRLNTATLPDTTGTTDGLIELRGAVGTGAPFTLPDGKVIGWGDDTELMPTNAGGDYWDISFQMPNDSSLYFKFFSTQAGTAQVDGWEVNPNKVLTPGTNDTTIAVHYFDTKGTDDLYWKPFEPKEDSIAVQFRVYMRTENALGTGKDYDPTNPDQIIGVRGDALGGVSPLDWGVTKFLLSRESDDLSKPGYDLYSGWAFYPESAAGTSQPYKFIIETDGQLGWEDLPSDRTFTVPAQDTTLHWVFFSNSPAASVPPATATVLFNVDLSPLEAIGLYSRARGDTLQVRGGFNGWDCPVDADDCRLQIVPGQEVYEGAFPLTAIPQSVQPYKFFIDFNDAGFAEDFGQPVPNPDFGYEEPLSTTGSDRTFTFEGNASEDQDLGTQYFNDILPGNIMPDGTTTDLTFKVDMSSALTNEARPFDAETDSVFVAFHDGKWLLTQGMSLDADQGVIHDFILKDEDGDGVYTGTLTVNGPTYSGLLYRYAYGSGTDIVVEAGGSTAGLGRRRQRFIVPGEDGNWPAAFSLPEESFQATGELPYEPNPAAQTGIEETGGELPKQMALSQNYPNPFRGATTIEYSVDRVQHVRLHVYDVMGRTVATLVDRVQPSNNYKVSFNGASLASGVYFYRLETDDKTITRRMVVVK
ncbi:MAG TPA: T9SS type A sorting domain-containing protein [Rhodothermales bacterium]|nr:T9SS type A sorting domain-containing protein [Rhodothermales bacterium]